MTDEMYQHVEKSIQEMPDKSFRAYAFKLIEQDMRNLENEGTMYDLIKEMKEQMEKGFHTLYDKIENKSFVAADKPQDITFDGKQDIKEGELVTSDVTGAIEEDYDNDF
jgi:hypothetical protein